MSLQPTEGIHYLVDLYAISAGPEDDPNALRAAETTQIKDSIDARLFEYHPDRLHGLAPEFQQRGERMTRLLVRARGILLDADKRPEYDELLTSWDGPVSTDGTPAMKLQDYLAMEVSGKSDDEIEGVFQTQGHMAIEMTGYSDERLSFLEEMIAEASDSPSPKLCAQYEDALLQRDRLLAIDEHNRSQLLGLSDISKSQYRVGIGYGEVMAGEVESARAATLQRRAFQAVGGVAVRLSLLAGEPAPTPSTDVATTPVELPTYFDKQAEKVLAIATEREEITRKRLDNLQLVYPEAGSQSQAASRLVVGITVKGNDKDIEDQLLWVGTAFDTDDDYDIPEDIRDLLAAANYKAVIAAGHNVATFTIVDHIEPRLQLTSLIEKHIEKYGLGHPEKNTS